MQAQIPENVNWGFVFIRCTYLDDEQWSSFLSALNKYQETPLPDDWHWTTIEDTENLNNATMLQASKAYQNWVDSVGADERPIYGGSSRYNYFIYVNEESIESVLRGSRARGSTSNFLILVDFRQHIESCGVVSSRPQITEKAKAKLEDDFADNGDDTWKLIDALKLKSIFLDVWLDRHGWYGYNGEWQDPPYIFYRYPDPTTEHVLLKNAVPTTGLNVYKMMKGIYAGTHERSICFEEQEATTILQRLRGHKGGEWAEEFPEYC